VALDLFGSRNALTENAGHVRGGRLNVFHGEPASGSHHDGQGQREHLPSNSIPTGPSRMHDRMHSATPSVSCMHSAPRAQRCCCLSGC
jgi:hypothetical protein